MNLSLVLTEEINRKKTTLRELQTVTPSINFKNNIQKNKNLYNLRVFHNLKPSLKKTNRYCSTIVNTQKLKNNSLNNLIPDRQVYKQTLESKISKIYNKSSFVNFNSLYQKKNKNRYNLAQNQKSLFVNPKNPQSIKKMSKIQRMYLKTYKQCLNQNAHEIGQMKPLQSNVCANNYLHSTLSVSALASRKFNSLQCKKRIKNIKTECSDFLDYPLSPHLIQQLKQIKEKGKRYINRGLNRQYLLKKHEQKSEFQEEQVLILDKSAELDQYLKQIIEFRKKNSRIYRSKYKYLQKIYDLARLDSFQHLDYYLNLKKVSQQNINDKSINKKRLLQRKQSIIVNQTDQT